MFAANVVSTRSAKCVAAPGQSHAARSVVARAAPRQQSAQETVALMSAAAIAASTLMGAPAFAAPASSVPDAVVRPAICASNPTSAICSRNEAAPPTKAAENAWAGAVADAGSAVRDAKNAIGAQLTGFAEQAKEKVKDNSPAVPNLSTVTNPAASIKPDLSVPPKPDVEKDAFGRDLSGVRPVSNAADAIERDFEDAIGAFERNRAGENLPKPTKVAFNFDITSKAEGAADKAVAGAQDVADKVQSVVSSGPAAVLKDVSSNISNSNTGSAGAPAVTKDALGRDLSGVRPTSSANQAIEREVQDARGAAKRAVNSVLPGGLDNKVAFNFWGLGAEQSGRATVDSKVGAKNLGEVGNTPRGQDALETPPGADLNGPMVKDPPTSYVNGPVAPINNNILNSIENKGTPGKATVVDTANTTASKLRDATENTGAKLRNAVDVAKEGIRNLTAPITPANVRNNPPSPGNPGVPCKELGCSDTAYAKALNQSGSANEGARGFVPINASNEEIAEDQVKTKPAAKYE